MMLMPVIFALDMRNHPRFNHQKQRYSYGGCSKGPCKGGIIGNTLHKKGDPNQTRNLHYGHFGDRYFEQLPYRVYIGVIMGICMVGV